MDSQTHSSVDSSGHCLAEKAETERILRAASLIKSKLVNVTSLPIVGIICGSGLAGLSKAVGNSLVIIPYEEIPGFPVVTVPGHHSQLLVGDINGIPVMIMLGRFHYYEGHPLTDVVFPIRVMASLGIKQLLVTNSAGAINPDFKVGDLMVIEDHISFPSMSGISPLRGVNLSYFGPRFPSLTHSYHPLSYKLIREAAQATGIPVEKIQRGVYVNLGGPTYETPAEIRFLRMIGGDVVGMSSIPEVIIATHCGMQVMAFSLVSNICVDQTKCPEYPKHEEVLAVTNACASNLEGLISALIPLFTFL